jgi:hypothetical protein
MTPRAVWALGALLLAVACSSTSDDDGRQDDIDLATSSSSASGSPSSSGPGGTATSTTGTGSSTSGSGGGGPSTGSGGSSNCTPITLASLLSTDTEAGGSSLVYEVEGLDPNKTHVAYIEFYDVAGTQQPGDYDLGSPPDDNYQSCAHCLLVYENFSDSSPIAFFPRAGSMTVAEADTAFNGQSSGSLSDVVLEEVTLMNTVTTPVVGGRCLSLASGSWDTTP